MTANVKNHIGTYLKVCTLNSRNPLCGGAGPVIFVAMLSLYHSQVWVRKTVALDSSPYTLTHTPRGEERRRGEERGREEERRGEERRRGQERRGERRGKERSGGEEGRGEERRGDERGRGEEDIVINRQKRTLSRPELALNIDRNVARTVGKFYIPKMIVFQR